MTPRADFPADVEVAVVSHNNLDTLKATLRSVADAGCRMTRMPAMTMKS